MLAQGMHTWCPARPTNSNQASNRTQHQQPTTRMPHQRHWATHTPTQAQQRQRQRHMLPSKQHHSPCGHPTRHSQATLATSRRNLRGRLYNLLTPTLTTATLQLEAAGHAIDTAMTTTTTTITTMLPMVVPTLSANTNAAITAPMTTTTMRQSSHRHNIIAPSHTDAGHADMLPVPPMPLVPLPR